jgi:hypothetical protein
MDGNGWGKERRGWQLVGIGMVRESGKGEALCWSFGGKYGSDGYMHVRQNTEKGVLLVNKSRIYKSFYSQNTSISVLIQSVPFSLSPFLACKETKISPNQVSIVCFPPFVGGGAKFRDVD